MRYKDRGLGFRAAAGGACLQCRRPKHLIFISEQVLHIVRHGESEYNAACAKDFTWNDHIGIFDPHLTEVGKLQVRSGQKRALQNLNIGLAVSDKHSCSWGVGKVATKTTSRIGA